MISAQPKYTTRVITENGLNNDIIKALHSAIDEATQEAARFAFKFKGKNDTETARNIWNFLRSLKYVKDPAGKQFIKLPNRLIATNGDCKSFSLLTAAILKNLGMPVTFRYTSYQPGDATPSHVYIITADEKGKQLIIDGVYDKFNQEVPFKHKTDHKMQISVLNGLVQQTATVTRGNKIKSFQSKVKPGSFIWNVLQNEKARKQGQKSNFNYNGAQLSAYLIRLKRRRALTPIDSFANKLFSSEIRAIENGTFSGTIKLNHSNKELAGIEDEIGKLSLKKLGRGIKKGLRKINPKNLLKGVKAVAFAVPRKSFQALVSLNVRGLATRMSKLSESDLRDFWVKKFGGQFNAIQKAINNGKKRRPLLGASKKVRAIKGIDGVDFAIEGEYIGAAAAAATAATAGSTGGVSVGAIIATSAPILVAIISLLGKKRIPDVAESVDLLKEGEDGKITPESAIEAAANYIPKAMSAASESGIIPERPLSNTEQLTKNSLGDDLSDEPAASSAIKINPLLIGGAALAAIFLFKKK
jgi:hypothetical protein